MNSLSSLIALILITASIHAQSEQVGKLYETPSSGTNPGQLGSAEGWTKNMGFRSLYSVTLSPDGNWVGIISHAKGVLVDLPATDGNTFYLLNAHTGAVAIKMDFLKDPQAKSEWADTAFQTKLAVEFIPKSVQISGPLFTGPHPDQVPFSRKIPLPPVTNEPL